MIYAYDRLRAEASALIAATSLVEASAVSLSEPKNKELADLAFPVFALAKERGVAPPALAAQIAENITSGGLIAQVEAAGGFVNVTADPEKLADAVLRDVETLGDSYGHSGAVGAGQKLLLEYSSPNIARKMHVGHLRSTVIGHSLRKIFEALGYDVIADNHLGDWGTQFGMLLAAIDEGKLTPWDDPDPVQSLIEIYAAFNAASKEHPEKRDAARLWFRRLEEGDAWARATWQRLIDITMVEFDATYARLGVSFHTQHGESYFEQMMPPLIEKALALGVARKEADGAISVTFDEDGKLPSCLLVKSDGATNYITRDAATCVYRWESFAPARNIYVVGQEQKLHLQQVFEIVRRLGYGEIADRSVHISFGKVSPPDGGRFSMREGNVVFLNDVLDEAVERAAAKMRENIAAGRTEITEAELPAISEMLGIGAVVYADLYQGPGRDIVFDWDRMLKPEGNTAMYIQYAHARCKSILRKAGQMPIVFAPVVPLESAELALVKRLMKLPHAVREAGEKFLPAIIAEWTYGLARALADFYESCPVLKAEPQATRASRLALVAATAQGLKCGLALLGIGAPERV